MCWMLTFWIAVGYALSKLHPLSHRNPTPSPPPLAQAPHCAVTTVKPSFLEPCPILPIQKPPPCAVTTTQ